MLTNLELADRLRVVMGRLARQLRQQSLGGLTPSQSSVLATLNSHGDLSMGMIAQYESITKPSTTGIVRRLIEKGLVERAADPLDLRSTIVKITAEGVRVLEQRRRERTAYLVDRIETLTNEERRILTHAVKILERIQGLP